jgi:hypothetical protein
MLILAEIPVSPSDGTNVILSARLCRLETYSVTGVSRQIARIGPPFTLVGGPSSALLFWSKGKQGSKDEASLRDRLGSPQPIMF